MLLLKVQNNFFRDRGGLVINIITSPGHTFVNSVMIAKLTKTKII